MSDKFVEFRMNHTSAIFPNFRRSNMGGKNGGKKGEGTQLAAQIEELNQSLKLVSSALTDLTGQLREMKEAQTTNGADQVHRTSGYVNWNSTHDVLKTEKWVTMSAFLDSCLEEKWKEIHEDNIHVVDEETRFPEDELYVNLNNPLVRVKLLYAQTCKAEVDRVLDMSKGEAHTVSSFEKEHGLKWVEPISEVSNITECIQNLKPVTVTVDKNAPITPELWSSEELKKEDSDEPEASSKKEDPGKDLGTKKLCKNFANILDEITQYNYHFLIRDVKEQFREVNNQKRLELMVELLYDKVLEKPGSSKVYAMLASKFARIEVPSDNNPDQAVHMRGLLINTIQKYFEKIVEMKIENDLVDEKNMENKARALATVKFIGELYNVKMLTYNIVDYCLKRLGNDLEEDKLECFCELIATAGKELDDSGNFLDKHFQKLHEIVNRKDKKINEAVLLMIQDIIDLRKRKWRVNAPLIKNLPKTIEEIQNETHKRALLIQLMNEFGTSGSEQKEQTKISHEDHRREKLAGENQYSVEALKLEGVSQKTQDYIQDPPECFTELGDDILDKLQADPSTREDIVMKYQNASCVMGSESVKWDPLDARDDVALGLKSNENMKTNLKSNIRTIIDQHIKNPDIEELKSEIEEYLPNDHADVVSEIINVILDKSIKEVKIIAKSNLYLVKLFAPNNFLAGLKPTFDVAPDLFIDIPYLYRMLGIIIAPLIATKYITIKQIFALSETAILNDQGNHLLSSLIETLYETEGLGVTKALWLESGMHVNQWMKEELVPASLLKIID